MKYNVEGGRRGSKKKRAFYALLACLLGGFVALNILAYNHARAMMTFPAGGEKTKSPETLSGLGKLRTLLTGVTLPRPENRKTPQDKGLPYEVHKFHSATNIELEGWYVPCSEAKGLVLALHGYGSSKSSMLDETEALHRLGYAVFLVDFRGHGGSSGNVTSIGYYEAEDVRVSVMYARKTFATGLPVVLYGKSMGAAAIMRAAARGKLDADLIIVEAVFDRMLTTVKNRFRTMRLPAFPAAELLVFWGGVQQGFNGFRHNPGEYAAVTAIPVLVLHGANDPRATLDDGRNFFAALKGPKQLEIFQGAKHESLHDVNPGQWENSVRNFMRMNAPGGKPQAFPERR